MALDILGYRDKHKDFYGDMPLDDVAKDAFQRGGYSKKTPDYDTWKKESGIDVDIEADRRRRNPTFEDKLRMATDHVAPKESSSILRRAIGDPLASLAKGAIIGIPEAIIGLADIPTMGYAGKGFTKLMRGRTFQDSRESFDAQFLSPEAIEAQEKVSQAKGFTETIKTAVQNPSSIVSTIMESAPSMVGGAAIGRMAMKGIGKAVTAKGITEAEKISRAIAAGAVGEGLISAGQNTEQLRQGIESGTLSPAQVAAMAGSGFVTGLISRMSAGLAKRLGIVDVDTLLAGANTGKVFDSAKTVLKGIIGSAITEGALEELPQSAQEQMAQNIATGKPILDGVAEAAAMGLLSGAGMGMMGAGSVALTQKREPKTYDDAVNKLRNAAYIMDVLDSGLKTGEFNGKPFTDKNAVELINESIKTGIYTEDYIDRFKDKYPQLRDGLNGLIADNITKKIDEEVTKEPTKPLANTMRNLSDVPDFEEPVNPEVKKLQDRITKTEDFLTRNANRKGEKRYNDYVARLEADKSKLLELTGGDQNGTLQTETEIENVAPTAPAAGTATPEVQTWFRGIDQVNKETGDHFFSGDESVAGDFGKVSKLEATEMPKNPLVVGSKEDLVETIGYKHDPMAEPKDIPKEERFDILAKKYAQAKGHDAIVYQNGTMEAPELHVFGKEETPPAPLSQTDAATVGAKEVKAGGALKQQENTPSNVKNVSMETKPAENAAKEPYQMTRDEYDEGLDASGDKLKRAEMYRDIRIKKLGKIYYEFSGKKSLHEMEIIKALRNGKTVPDEILKDYPELQKKETDTFGDIPKVQKEQWGKYPDKQLKEFADKGIPGAEIEIAKRAKKAEANEPKEIFIRAAERRDLSRVQKSLKEIPDKFGYEKVYKRYGKQGRGFYYNKVKVNEVKSEKPAPKVSGAENLVTFLQRAGKVRLGEEFQDKTGDAWSRAHGFRSKDRSREMGDIASVTSQNGKMAMDEAASFVNAEGFRDKNGSKFTDRTLFETLSNSEGRNILHPDKAESIINREIEKKAREHAEREEAAYYDRINEAIPEVVAGESEANRGETLAYLEGKADEEGYNPEEAYAEINSFLDDVTKAQYLEQERRVNFPHRKKVSEMTPEERAIALLTDHLTGLKNKRAYEEAQRLPFQTSIDIDGLKYINDTYGHDAGNDLLKKVGEALNRASEGELVYHLHGDEFAIETKTPEISQIIIDETKKILKAEPLEFNGEKYVADFSYGIAETTEGDKPLLDADKAMMANKTERRVERGKKTPKEIKTEDTKAGKQTTIPGASEAETFSLTAKEPETPVVKGAKLTPKNLQPKEKIGDLFGGEKAEGIKERQDIPELDAQIRTIKEPVKDSKYWTIEIGVQESLGEQGGDILTWEYDAKPNLDEIKKDILDHYKKEKIEINKEVGIGIVAKSGRDEMREEAIDKVLTNGKEKSESTTDDSGEEQREPITSDILTLSNFDSFMSNLRDGKGTVQDVKAAFNSLKESEDAITKELSAMTKDALLKRMGGMRAYRYKNDKKAAIVKATYNDMVSDFALGNAVSYQPFKEKYEDVIGRMVDKYTEADLAEFAKRVEEARNEYKQRMESKIKAIKNPETLEEFETFIRVNGKDKMTPEQSRTYDELVANKIREGNAAELERKATVRAATANVNAEIIETKHTKTGADLFVVQLEERVDREVYNEMNRAAKKMGGWYSSYKVGGAVPGFQFKTRESAEAFKKYVSEGDTQTATEVALERRETRKDEKKASAITRLREMAARITERANEELSRDRQTNTARRARMANNAENAALRSKRIAETMNNLADAIEAGEANHLSGLRTKAQIEQLNGMVSIAKYAELRKKYDSYAEQEKHKGEPATIETVDYLASDVHPKISKDTILQLANKGLEKDGIKRIAQKWIKLIGQAKGENVVIRNEDHLEDIKKLNDSAGGDYSPLTSIIDNSRRMRDMGIETPEMERAALREFIQYRAGLKEADKAKMLERSLVGQKVGSDFFPTPKATAERMIEEADISEGMDVLEPSAGNGNIAEVIREAGHEPDTIELSGQLKELLEAKGFNVVGDNFLDYSGKKYDRIIMNPPFSNNKDIEHVRHAYELLKPNGRIVAIMGEGAFFRNDKKATEFREWLDRVGGTSEKLAEGTFTDKSLMATTGTNARMVVIDKGTEMYRIGEQGAYQMPTIADVQDVFKGQEVSEINGGFLIKTHAGEVFVESVNSIDANTAALNIGYSKGKLSEKEVIAGKYDKGVISLVKGAADKFTLSHESVHYMEDIGVIPPSETSLLKRHIQNLVSDGKFETVNEKDIGGAEDRANFLADALTRPPKGLLGRILNKIHDFIDKLVNAFGIRTIRGITRDVETGNIYSRENEEQREARLDLEGGLTKGEESATQYSMTKDKGTADIPAKDKPQAEAEKYNDTSKIIARPVKDVGLKFGDELPEDVYLHGSRRTEGDIDNFSVSTSPGGTLYLTKRWETAEIFSHNVGKNESFIKAVELNQSADIIDLSKGADRKRLADLLYDEADKHEFTKEKFADDFKNMDFHEAGLSDDLKYGEILYDENIGAIKDNFGNIDVINDYAIKTYNPKLLPNPSRPPEVGGQYQLRKQTDPPVSRDPKVLNSYLKDETDAIVQTITNKFHPKSMTWLETMLKSPEWFDHPQIQNIVKLFMRDRNELYHETFNELNAFNDSTVAEAAKALRNKGLSLTERLSGKVSPEYQTLMDMIDDGDTRWVRNKKIPLATQLKHFEDAWRKKGATDEIINVWRSFRQSYDKALDLMTKQLRDMIEEIKQKAKAKGERPDFAELNQTLKGALAQMEEWRGFYAPRQRRGNWAVQAYKEHGPLEQNREWYRAHHVSELSAQREAKKLERDGWKIYKVGETEKLPESVYQDVRAVSTAKLIDAALDKLGKKIDLDQMATFNAEILREVSDMIKSRGFRSTMIHRGRGNVVRGFIEDPIERHLMYINSVSGGISKARVARMAMQELLGDKEMGEPGIDPVKEPKAFSVAQDYIQEQLRNADASDRIIGLAKSIATFKFLGFNLRSLAVNTTAIVTTAPASIHQYAMGGKGSFAEIYRQLAKAGKDYGAAMAGKDLGNPDEAAFIADVHKKGWDDAQYTREALGEISKAHSRVWATMMDASMYLFGVSEKWNRGTTMLAAYRLARKNGMSHDQAAEAAKTASDKAHGVYGKSTMPMWAQGTNPAAKLGQMMYVYSKFGHNYLQMLYDMGFKKKNIKGAMFAFLSPLVLAGGAAFPFKDAIFGFAGFILGLLGFDRDPEKWVWDQIREHLGGDAEKFGRHGLTGAMGVDISGSLSIGVGVPKDFIDLTGAIGGVVTEITEAGASLANREPGRAAEHLLPTGLANPLRAMRESKEGATTRNRRRVWDEKGKPYVPGTGASIARGFGFRSTEQAVLSERTWEGHREQGKISDRRNSIYERYRAWMLGGRDRDEYKKIVKEVQDFNRFIRENRLRGESYITSQSLKNQARRMMRPSKKERSILEN